MEILLIAKWHWRLVEASIPKMKRYDVRYHDEIQKNTWIADSGALTHMGDSDVGSYDGC